MKTGKANDRLDVSKDRFHYMFSLAVNGLAFISVQFGSHCLNSFNTINLPNGPAPLAAGAFPKARARPTFLAAIYPIGGTFVLFVMPEKITIAQAKSTWKNLTMKQIAFT